MRLPLFLFQRVVIRHLSGIWVAGIVGAVSWVMWAAKRQAECAAAPVRLVMCEQYLLNAVEIKSVVSS